MADRLTATGGATLHMHAPPTVNTVLGKTPRPAAVQPVGPYSCGEEGRKEARVRIQWRAQMIHYLILSGTVKYKYRVRRLREFVRQVKEEVVSISRNKIHQTWELNFSPSLNTRPKKPGSRDILRRKY